VVDPAYQVELTTNFLERLESIEAFVAELEFPQVYDALLAELRDQLMPNLCRFPRMGRRYLERPPQSVEAIEQLGLLPADVSDRLRIVGCGDHLILYFVADEISKIYLLTIRHERQLSFDFDHFWPDVEPDF
jgi:plasmid stabilization system protein ParE